MCRDGAGDPGGEGEGPWQKPKARARSQGFAFLAQTAAAWSEGHL